MCEEDQWWVLLFVAGAVFGEVELSLFVAGAVFGEIWNDSRSAKCFIFQYKILVVGMKSNLGCEAGCGRRFHGRILLGSVPHCKWRFSCFREISEKFRRVILRGRRSIWWCLRLIHVTPLIVNSISCVKRIDQESHFAWQAQYYLVSFDNDTCYSAHRRWEK